MARTYAVIGAGIAGTAAAEALRQADDEGRILLIGSEERSVYSRIRLPEVLSGSVDPEALLLHKDGWYDERRIERLRGVSAESIDPDARSITLDDGRSVAYDALLLATGARPFVPPFPGGNLSGVMTVRSDRDTLALREAALETGSLTVIGGGVLGLEMAYALASQGVKVSVIEIFPWLLNRQVDPEGGRLIQDLLEEGGLRFHLDVTVEAIEGGDRACEVKLKDGGTVGGSVILVSAGIASETALARALGCDCGRGIRIDGRGATSVDGIFAAGDCAEHEGVVYGIWPAAQEQGRVAGANMGGGEALYRGTIRSNTVQVAGIKVFSAGEIDAEGKLSSEVIREDKVYRRRVVDGEGRLVGAVLINDLTGWRDMMKEIQSHAAG